MRFGRTLKGQLNEAENHGDYDNDDDDVDESK